MNLSPAIYTRLTVEQREALERLAQQRTVSLSAMIRMALQEYLEHHNALPRLCEKCGKVVEMGMSPIYISTDSDGRPITQNLCQDCMVF